MRSSPALSPAIESHPATPTYASPRRPGSEIPEHGCSPSRAASESAASGLRLPATRRAVRPSLELLNRAGQSVAWLPSVNSNTLLPPYPRPTPLARHARHACLWPTGPRLARRGPRRPCRLGRLDAAPEDPSVALLPAQRSVPPRSMPDPSPSCLALGTDGSPGLGTCTRQVQSLTAGSWATSVRSPSASSELSPARRLSRLTSCPRSLLLLLAGLGQASGMMPRARSTAARSATLASAASRACTRPTPSPSTSPSPAQPSPRLLLHRLTCPRPPTSAPTAS